MRSTEKGKFDDDDEIDDRRLSLAEYNFRLNLRICLGYTMADEYNAFVKLHPLRTDPAWKIWYAPKKQQREFDF